MCSMFPGLCSLFFSFLFFLFLSDTVRFHEDVNESQVSYDTALSFFNGACQLGFVDDAVATGCGRIVHETCSSWPMFSAILIYYIQPSTEYLLNTNRYRCATITFSAKSSLSFSLLSSFFFFCSGSSAGTADSVGQS